MLTDNGTFRAYHIVKEYSSEEHRVALEKTIGRESSKNYPEQLYTKTVRDFQTGSPRTRSGDTSKRVAAFDFLNIGCGIPGEVGAITILNDRSVALYSLPPVRGPVALSPKMMFARGGVGNGEYLKFIEPISNLKAAEAVQEVQKHIAASKATHNEGSKEKKVKAPLKGDEEDLSEVASLSSRERRERLLLPEKVPSFQDALTLMAIPRLRCKEGYMLEPGRNQKIVSDDSTLQDLWDWIGRKIFSLPLVVFALANDR